MERERRAIDIVAWFALQIFHMRRLVYFQNKIGTHDRIAAVAGLRLRWIEQVAPKSMILKSARRCEIYEC